MCQAGKTITEMGANQRQCDQFARFVAGQNGKGGQHGPMTNTLLTQADEEHSIELVSVRLPSRAEFTYRSN